MMKMKTKAIPILMITLIGIYILAPMISAETAEEWTAKGISFGESGEYEKAIEAYNKAIELNPNDAEAYFWRGRAYIDLERYERAIEDFDKAIELNPNEKVAYRYRDLALSRSKKQKLAPGFGVIFTVTGLLAMAYLSRRKV